MIPRQPELYNAVELILRYEDSPSPKRPAARTTSRIGLRTPDKPAFSPTRPQSRATPFNFRFDSHIRFLESRDRISPSRDTFSRACTPTTAARMRLTRTDLFERLVTACISTPQHKQLEDTINKQRRAETVSLRRWRQAQIRLKKVHDCDPDLLVPLYALEKSSELITELDVLEAAKQHRTDISLRTQQAKRRL